MSDLLNLTSKFLLMSELLSDTDEEKVANKQKIVFATMKNKEKIVPIKIERNMLFGFIT